MYVVEWWKSKKDKQYYWRIVCESNGEVLSHSEGLKRLPRAVFRNLAKKHNFVIRRVERQVSRE